MSTGYGWEGVRQVCAMLLGARHIPERLRSGPCPHRGAMASARPYLTLPYLTLPYLTLSTPMLHVNDHLFKLSGANHKLGRQRPIGPVAT